MLKKQKHKVKRRNTAPPTNLPTTPVRANVAQPVPSSAPYKATQFTSSSSIQQPQNSPPMNLADLCDSPTHATAV